MNSVSATFANNIGTGSAVVYNGNATLSTANQSGTGTSKVFDIILNLQTAYLYNPASGNLVADIRNNSGGLTGFIDAYSDPSSAPRRRLVFSDGNANAATGTVQFLGAPTRFTFAPVVVPEAGNLTLFGFAFVPVVATVVRRRRAASVRG